MNNNAMTGFSIIEVMIACLIFAIVIISFSNYQHTLTYFYHYLSNQQKAQQIAFSLLDSYPNIARHIVPNNWQYNIRSEPYTSQCQLVSVTITTKPNKQINQQRLFCHIINE
ncbi:prepilin-type N-terminal cleavage/methylation domain-containing protein [Gilliamella sp. B2969]|uniref:type IV pilus modification PilV family protein n=1 Tax=unclassified Gilliamella TaxID=2685620 RepID=UPI00226982F1|nr:MULTISPECIES: prepilin-type N-terminal cleavage/methylation domain-containing protein [unclassified Gilliamella]MCX8730389.1 prepilin-type N-terminal cleavage/methylation domain-containing protein [Gilliamella sp. B2969]MCX8738046.1 prepilin-type N-terminal cleavage/methylation domain-containing protein [Gilliamella sp. B2824]